MPEDTPVAPSTTAAPAAAAPTAPAAPPAAAPPSPPVEKDPPAAPWLGERLHRERRNILKDLGYKVPKDADIGQTIAQIKAEKAEKKTKNKELRNTLDEEKANRQKWENVAKAQDVALKIIAESNLSELPEKDRAAVKAIAGDDAMETLKQISAYRQLRASMAPSQAPAAQTPAQEPAKAAAAPAVTAATATPAPQAQAPIAPPAQTAPAAPAPPAASGEGKTVRQQYDELKGSSDAATATYGRALFALINRDEILRPLNRPAKGQ